jgi:hypothetical protein
MTESPEREPETLRTGLTSDERLVDESGGSGADSPGDAERQEEEQDTPPPAGGEAE